MEGTTEDNVIKNNTIETAPQKTTPWKTTPQKTTTNNTVVIFHGVVYAILGALTLYLDFINLFLMLLRIFGNRR